MGNFFTTQLNTYDYFSKEQLRKYSECTYFTETEINKLYSKFADIDPGTLDLDEGDAETRLSFEDLHFLPELKECPFSDRLCEVFSTDGSGIHFEDFLDMMSVFSDHAPWTLKVIYAFKVFDFNNDSFICEKDMNKVILSITDAGHGISEEDIHDIFEAILQEIQPVEGDKISYTEFEHMVARAPDFTRVFRIPMT